MSRNILIYVAKIFPCFLNPLSILPSISSFLSLSSEPLLLPSFLSLASRRLSLPLSIMPDFHCCIQSPAFISPSPAPPFRLFIEPPFPHAYRSHTPPSISSFYADPSHPSPHPSLERFSPPTLRLFVPDTFPPPPPKLPTHPSVSSFIFQTHSSRSPFSLFIPPAPVHSLDPEESADFRLFVPNPFPPSPHFCFVHPAFARFPHPEGDSSSGGRILLDASRIKEREKWLRWINDGFGDAEGNGGMQEAERGLDLERREATADTVSRGRAEALD